MVKVFKANKIKIHFRSHKTLLNFEFNVKLETRRRVACMNKTIVTIKQQLWYHIQNLEATN